MAEYYPLLAKAVGSLPNSTPETRRVVYERARKALIGQLRTLHPPVPEEDIERESVELDRAVQRLERELASGGIPAPTAAAAVPMPAKPASAPILPPRPPRPASVLPEGATAAERKPITPVRAKMPKPKTPASTQASSPAKSFADSLGSVAAVAERLPETVEARAAAPQTQLPSSTATAVADDVPATSASIASASDEKIASIDPPAAVTLKTRGEAQRPIAPQPRASEGSRRPVWIIPVGIGLVVLAIAAAAYKLRDTRQTVAHVKPTEQVAQGDSGKLSERIGGAETDTSSKPANEPAPTSAAPATTSPAVAPAAAPLASSANPEVPVAHRAALLIEAPDEPNKVKTFLGTVVWKLNNVNEGPAETVGLAVEADIDLPDDKMKATITFEKNTDSSLPASHTIKLRFMMQPGSATGNIKQISVPQLRQEDSPSGEALAGVTVSVIPNTFLVGLSPGNAETINIKQLKELQWIDVPILLDSGKIAKLTFEKGPSGERDLNEAIAAWQKS